MQPSIAFLFRKAQLTEQNRGLGIFSTHLIQQVSLQQIPSHRDVPKIIVIGSKHKQQFWDEDIFF